jgi:hypothetical protein
MPPNTTEPEDREEQQRNSDIDRYERLQHAAERQIKRIADAYELHSSLIKTVVVSTFGLATVITALVGFGFYHSMSEFKQSLRDSLGADQKQMSQLIDNSLSSMTNRIESALTSMTNRIEIRIRDSEGRIDEGIDRRFDDKNIEPLIEAKAKVKVDEVTEKTIVTSIHQHIDPQISLLTNELAVVQSGVNEALLSGANASNITETVMTILRAENDERAAFFEIHNMTVVGTNRYQTVLSEAEYSALQQAVNVAASLSTAQPDWKMFGLDPNTNSLTDLSNYFWRRSDSTMRIMLLQRIQQEERFPRDSKLAFYRTILPSINSLRVLAKLCQILGTESGNQMNVYGFPAYETWLDMELRNILVTNFPAVTRTNQQIASAAICRAMTCQSMSNSLFAAKYYEVGLKAEPTNADLLNGYAWLLATSTDDSVRDGAKAVKLANRACELSGWKQWNMVGTLAAAYAEHGEFDKATNYESKAISMPGIDPLLVGDEKRRLETFKSHKATHEMPEDIVNGFR